MTENLQRITFHASAVETVNGESAEFNVPGNGPMALYINVTAITGAAPQFDLDLIAIAPDDQEYILNSITQLTGVGKERILITDLPDEKVKLAWTLGGTITDVTFSASAVVENRG